MSTTLVSEPTDDVSSAPLAPTCAVVLVCWNNKAYLEPCLRSLFESGMRHACEVVVVDNGSTDGSQELLRQSFPQVRIVQNAGNVGLGKASNQGIACTQAPYILLLNNDTIVNGASLDALIDFLERTPDAGGAGGTLLNGDGTFQAAYNRFPSLVEEFLIATRLGDLVRPEYPSIPGGDRVTAVDWIGSACLLLRRAALDTVGLLDESYFIYGDETDLEYRLARAGWKVYYVPGVTTIHFGGRSMDRWRRRKMVYRGKMLFARKHYGLVQQWLLRGLLGALTVAKVVVWGAAFVFPARRERARRELASNAEVLQLCLHLD
ncbi:MAG: glycosyltransferase family 2 protein [Vicinamibacterales bacterium]